MKAAIVNRIFEGVCNVGLLALGHRHYMLWPGSGVRMPEREGSARPKVPDTEGPDLIQCRVQTVECRIEVSRRSQYIGDTSNCLSLNIFEKGLFSYVLPDARSIEVFMVPKSGK